MKVKIPKMFYEDLNSKALDEIIATYIKQQDYENLQIALSARQDNSSVLREAVQYLQPEIIDIILMHTKKGDETLNIDIDRAVDQVADIQRIDLDNVKLINITEQEFREIKGKIIKALVNFKVENINEINKTREEKIKIDQCSIEILALYIREAELKQFIEANNIEVADFKDTYIPYLLFKNTFPVMQVVPAKCSAQEILLARTYIREHETSQLARGVYAEMLNWSDVRKILHFVAMEIVKGDAVKVLFTTTSCYNVMQNVICVNIKPQGGFTVESIVAHEFAHYLMYKLYNNGGIPFQINLLDAKCYHSININKTYHNYLLGITRDQFHDELLKILGEYADVFYAYQQPSINLLNAADNMLSTKPQEESFNNAEKYIEFLKECTILPIFFLNSYNKFNEKATKPLNDVIKSDAEVQKITCLLISNMLKLDLFQHSEYGAKLYQQKNIKDSLDYVLQECLPLISKQFNLLPEDIFFLERVVNLMFRYDEEERLSEYIVRYPEAAVLNHQDKIHNPKIMAGFNGLKKYWDTNIAPIINNNLHDFIKIQNQQNLDDLGEIVNVSLIGDLIHKIHISDFDINE